MLRVMKFLRYTFLLVVLAAAAPMGASAQARRPTSGKGTGRNATKPGQKALVPAPIDAARRVEGEDDRPALIITKMKLADPVLVFYQAAAPNAAVQQLLMDEKNLPLLRTESLERLVERREVFIDGLGNYDPPGSDAQKYRLTGVSLLASSEKRRPAPDGRSTYARLKVPSPGELYVVRESAEDYRHFVSGPQKQGARIDFAVNGLPGVDSVRAVYTLRKIDASERGAGGGDIIR